MLCSMERQYDHTQALFLYNGENRIHYLGDARVFRYSGLVDLCLENGNTDVADGSDTHTSAVTLLA